MSISGAISRALSDTGGGAGVEFALMSPALILFMIGTVDLGSLAYQKAEVVAAANGAALYAMHNCDNRGCNTGNVATAAQNATPLGQSVTASATPVYYCSSSGSLTSAASAGAACAAGGTAGTYIQVSTQATYAPLISWGTLSFPATMSGQALVRIS